ncbi:MAG: amidase [Cyanobacteria bacterium CRU_2_1]|nr:amidase [Cyanobacteria bacterium RU_5_0]NJR59804.1 amidase [Cyanobacteria bacterium CRU_2_1]
MNSIDLAFAPALEQAHLIRNKEISPIELTQLYLQRIEQLDPELGSFFTVIADQALEDAKAKTARLATGETNLPPFFGVPTAIKDLSCMAGVRCTFGSKVMKQNIATYDDAATARIKAAGFVVLGKTATSEMGSLPYTEPEGFPPARNPWNLDHTPGGSSGGAAAAVAAGLVPIAHGSDGGGSVRGPAFCCGLVGIKPSRGRVSYAPIGDALNGIATHGSIGRTVADAAALLDVLSGYVTGDPYWLPDPDSRFVDVALQAIQEPAKPLRVAFSSSIAPIGDADPICQQAVHDTVHRLEKLGHHLEPGSPDCSDLVEPFKLVWRTGISACGLPLEAMQPMNQWLYEHADSSGDYQKAVWAMQMIARRIVAFFNRYDALVLPTYMHPAIRVGEWAELSPFDTLENIIRWIAPCPLANTTGQPAIAIPTGFTDTGLPIGVQIVGRPADEATIIALAAQIEAVTPWSQHRPAFATRE